MLNNRLGPETRTIALNLNDRLRRRIFLIENIGQKCITAAWIEDEPLTLADRTINGIELFKLLSKAE